MQKVDRQFCGAQVGEQGPLESRLKGLGELKGFVFGAFGEASKDVHELVQQLASARLAKAGLSKGKKGGERKVRGERSVVVGQLRRALSVGVVRAQAESLVRKLSECGAGAEKASARRRRTWELFCLEKERGAWKLGSSCVRASQWGREAFSSR